MENAASAGIFHRLHSVRQLPSSFVPIECKNYSTEVANPEIDQLAGRFSVNRGKAGLLVCRRFADRDLFVRRCRDTLTDGRGLIVGIDDTIVARWLGYVEDERRQDVEADLAKLVDEIYVPDAAIAAARSSD